MRKVLMAISIALLVALLIGAVGYASGWLSEPANKQLMLIASIAWFVLAPFWMTSRAP